MNRYDEIVLRTSKTIVGLNTNGGYVSSWKVLDPEGIWQDILYVGSQLKRSGIPILFPYFGKAEKWPQHGFGRNCTWRLVEQTEARISMELRSDELNAAEREWYQHNFITQIIVEVGDVGELLYSISIENVGSTAMPIAPGLHPYWPIVHDKKQQLRIDGIDGFDATQIDWTEAPPDNRYDFNGKSVVHFPDRELIIEDVSDHPVVKHLVVWSQTPTRDPDYDFVCIEPVVGYNYDIDRNPVVVESGEIWSMKVKFGVRF